MSDLHADLAALVRDRAVEVIEAGGLRSRAVPLADVEALLAAHAPTSEPATNERARCGRTDQHPLHPMPCDSGCQPDWHKDWCAIYDMCPGLDPAPHSSSDADRDAGLSEDERQALIASLRREVDHGASCTCCPGLIRDLAPAVERIVAARVDEAISAALIVSAARAQPEGNERVEWGVIEDRTEDGLGRLLVAIRANEDLARRAAREAHSERGYPVAVKRRAVTFGEWTEVGGDE